MKEVGDAGVGEVSAGGAAECDQVIGVPAGLGGGGRVEGGVGDGEGLVRGAVGELQGGERVRHRMRARTWLGVWVSAAVRSHAAVSVTACPCLANGHRAKTQASASTVGEQKATMAGDSLPGSAAAKNSSPRPTATWHSGTEHRGAATHMPVCDQVLTSDPTTWVNSSTRSRSKRPSSASDVRAAHAADVRDREHPAGVYLQHVPG